MIELQKKNTCTKIDGQGINVKSIALLELQHKLSGVTGQEQHKPARWNHVFNGKSLLIRKLLHTVLLLNYKTTN